MSPLRRSRCGRRVVPEAPSGGRWLPDRRVRVRDRHVPRSSLRGTPSSGAATWRAPCDRAAPRRGRCSTRRGPRALPTGPDGHVDPPDRVERVTGIGPARPARDPRNCRPRPAQCLALARTSCVPRRRSPPSGDAHRGSLEHLVVEVGVDGAPDLDEQGEGQRRRGRAGGAPPEGRWARDHAAHRHRCAIVAPGPAPSDDSVRRRRRHRSRRRCEDLRSRSPAVHSDLHSACRPRVSPFPSSENRPYLLRSRHFPREVRPADCPALRRPAWHSRPSPVASLGRRS